MFIFYSADNVNIVKYFFIFVFYSAEPAIKCIVVINIVSPPKNSTKSKTQGF